MKASEKLSKITMGNPIVKEFLEEFKITQGMSIVDDDLTDKDYLVILRKTVKELGAYATEKRYVTLKFNNGVVSTEDLDISIILSIDKAGNSVGGNIQENFNWMISPNTYSNIESYSVNFFGSNSISDMRVMQYSSNVMSRTSTGVDYRFDDKRQILLIPTAGSGSMSIEYMAKISDIDYLIEDPYWVTRLSELYMYNVWITLGLIYNKLTVNSSPYNLHTDLFSRGTDAKDQFMEKLREELWTFSPR